MANKIKPKRSYTANAVPTTSDLDTNELAIRWDASSPAIFTKNAAGNIVSVTLGGSGGSGSIVTAASVSAFPASGSATNLYITSEDQRIWRWDATASIYVESGPIGGGGFAFASVPASPTATGTAGSVAYDSLGNVYVCTATNTWYRASADAWTPWNVSGLQLWLDFSDFSTLYDSTSGGSLVVGESAVARINDKSSNGRNFTQPTSGSRPLRKTAQQNGRDALLFDGSDDSLVGGDYLGGNTGSISVFVVLKSAVGGATREIISKAIDGGGWLLRLLNDGKLNASNFSADFNSSTSVTTSSPVTATAYTAIGMQFTAGAFHQTTFRRNGITLTTAMEETGSGQRTPTSNSSLMRIGAQRYSGTDYFPYSGNIAEVIVYNAALSASELASVDAYLVSKWGIA
jgi:hypothetical protein